MNDATTSPWDRPRLLARLDELGLAYREAAHQAVHTMSESAVLDMHLAGSRCKNLLVQNKKGSARFLIVTVPDARVDLGALGRMLEVGRLSFATPDTMQALLGVTPGAASPFALAADIQCKVRLLMDARLESAPDFLFHPLVNTATLRISRADLMRFLAAENHAPTFVNLPLQLC